MALTRSIPALLTITMTICAGRASGEGPKGTASELIYAGSAGESFGLASTMEKQLEDSAGVSLKGACGHKERFPER